MQRVTAISLLAVLAACGGKPADDTSQPLAKGADSLVPIGDVQKLPPPGTTSTTTTVTTTTTPPVKTPPPPPPVKTPPAKSTSSSTTTTTTTPPPAKAPASATLPVGQLIHTTMIDSVHSRVSKVGDVVRARVSQDVMSPDGRVVIPAGSVISMHIGSIAMANSRGEKGTLTMTANTVDINGTTKAIGAIASDYEYEMKARGITSGDVAKTGAGAVAGAIIGRVVGGKKGTIVGAVGGGAVGAAVASSTADRDIVLSAGKSVTMQLNDTFTKPSP